MAKTILPPDPLVYGTAARPVRLDMWQNIIKIHFPEDIVVIAEVPERLTALFTLDPTPSLDTGGTFNSDFHSARGVYDIGDEIPKTDIEFSLITTADTHGNTSLDDLASTQGLVVGRFYDVTATHIPADTRFLFSGGTAGSISKTASSKNDGDVTISSNPQFLLVDSVDSTSNILTVLDQWIDSGDPGLGYLINPQTRFAYNSFDYPTGDALDNVTAHLPGDYGSNPERYFLAFNDPVTPGPPVEYNGSVMQGDTIGFPPAGSFLPAWIFQVMFRFYEETRTYLINMALVNRVSVTQLPMSFSASGFFLPGYLPHNGVVLRAYEDAHFFVGNDWHVNAMDITGTIPILPTWETTIAPSDPAPGAPTEIAQFDKDGVL